MNMPRLDKGLLRSMDEAIEKADWVTIVSHMNADGDAVGSLLGCYHLLVKHGKKNVTLVLPNGVPETFGYLPGSEKVLNGDVELARCEEALREADVVIAVDFNGAGRIDQLGNALLESKGVKLLIDHHHNPDVELMNLRVSVPELSSTCEAVYWVFKEMWGENCMNRETAQCLYSGICTDTGSFAYSNEDPSLYEAAAGLVSYGIDAADIHNRIDNTFSVARMKFWGFAIGERLVVDVEHKFAYFYFSLEDMQRGGVTGADLEGLVSYTLKMKEIEVGALVREEVGRIKVSLRSKYGVDVNVIAREHFGGGGHTKAAGATCVGWSLEETIDKLRKIFMA